MIISVSGYGEFFATEVACIRFLACVDPHMDDQGWFLKGLVLALIAFEYLRVFSVLDTLVSQQSLFAAVLLKAAWVMALERMVTIGLGIGPLQLTAFGHSPILL